MARCCGGSTDVKVANFRVNQAENQLEVVLTNGQTFSVNRFELEQFLGLPVGTGNHANLSMNNNVLTLTNPDGFTSQVNLSSLVGINTPATDSQAGTVRLATSAETIAGQSTSSAVTPAGLQDFMAQKLAEYKQQNPIPTAQYATDSQAGIVTKAYRVLDNAGNQLGFLVN